MYQEWQWPSSVFVGFSRHVLIEWRHILFLISAALSFLDVRHTAPTMIILKCAPDHVTPMLEIFHWLFRAFKTKINMMVRPLCLNVQSLHYKNASEPLIVLPDLCFSSTVFFNLSLPCPGPLKNKLRNMLTDALPDIACTFPIEACSLSPGCI